MDIKKEKEKEENKMKTENNEAIAYFQKFTEYTFRLAKDEERLNGKTIYQKDLEKRTKYFQTILSIIKEFERKNKSLIHTNKSYKGIINKYNANLKNLYKKYTNEYKKVENLSLLNAKDLVLQEISCMLDDIKEINRK